MDPSAALAGLKYLVPELFLLGVAALTLVVHIFLPKRGRRVAGIVALAGLVAGIAVIILTPLSPGEIYSGSLTVDGFALFLKAVVLAAGALSILLAFRFFNVEGQEPGEAYSLIVLSLIGMMLSASSLDLIVTYVAFELFAIPSYILAGIFKKERRSAEAGIKYFFLGSLSSGIMLLGMVLIFAVSGETRYAVLGRALPGANEHIVLTGMILFFAGLFFKAALAPFHMWAPDVYVGAPTPLAAFLSTAPKAAVLALLVRLMVFVFPRFEPQWASIFQVVALVTMFWGNIAALLQKNLKRLLAYSSIAHAGYLAIGLAAWGEPARTAVLFYIAVYGFMNIAAFSMILLVRKKDGFGEEIEDLAGLSKRSPFIAVCVLIILLSLVGIPPTAGFFGKYFLFAAAVGRQMYLLVVAGAVNSAISLFYYFRIGRALFMEEGFTDVPPDPSLYAKIVLAFSAAVMLLLGVLPSLLTEIAASALLRT
jgi:NADH-quinone oxidoreductase subunit N